MYFAMIMTGSGYLCYGPFADGDSARSWVSQQDFPASYYVGTIFTPPSYPPAAPIKKAQAATGQWVAVLFAMQPSGSPTLIGYGPFDDEDEADAYIATRPFPGDCQSAAIEAAT